jgi:hypothetical protein
MSIKTRLKQLEAKTPRLPWLVLTVNDRPSHEQITQIDAAQKSGRCVIVHIEHGDSLWTNRAHIPPPWEQE